MDNNRQPELFSRWQVVTLAILFVGILVGIAGFILALVTGYRTLEGQSILMWSSSILSVASLAVLVVLLTSRNRPRYRAGK
jgi:hypothetical protein